MKTITRLFLLGSLLSLTVACGGDDREVTAIQIENGVWADVGHGDSLRVEGDVRTRRDGHTLFVEPDHGNDGTALVRMPFFVREIRTRGNAEVVMRPMVRLDYLSLDAAGTSSIIVAGVTTDMSIYVRGDAHIDASGMNAQHVDIDASGNSVTSVFVTQSIRGTVDGSAELTVIGEGDATGLSADGSVTFIPEPQEPAQ